MKQQWFRSTLLLCVSVVLGATASSARAQEGQGKFVTQAAARLIKLIDISNKSAYSLQDNSFSIGGGWMKQSPEAWFPLYTVELKQGRSYRFIAAGDADAKDVDLDILDPSGKIVAKDEKTDPEAVVDYVPVTSGRYTVRIRLFDSANNYPCVVLAVVMSKKD